MIYKLFRASFAALALLVVLTASEGRADLITGVAIHDFSSEGPAHWGRGVNNLVNGSGMVGDLHAVSGGPGMWHTLPEDFVPSENNFAHVTFDLGNVYDLDEIRVWNYGGHINGIDGPTRAGVRDFRISVSSSVNAPSFTSIGDFTLSRVVVSNGFFGAESLSVSAENVRFIRFDLFSNLYEAWDGRSDDVVGLSEVRFSGNLSSVPEPSTLSLLAVGFAIAWAKRRRRFQEGVV